jgi:hypothetical protein
MGQDFLSLSVLYILREMWAENFGGFAGLWLKAMGCSLLVSLASLVCLVLLPVIFCEFPASPIAATFLF